MVLFIALIVLVAMTLAGIALVRSVDTTNVIAGNLAFQQSATNSGDTGTEFALTWLQTNQGINPANLYLDVPAQGYIASFNPAFAVGQSWDHYWNTVLVPAGVVASLDASGNQIAYCGATVSSCPTNAAGYSVSYVIQRLCNAAGDPTSVGVDCAQPNAVSLSGASSRTAGTVALKTTAQYFYRITSRVAGPRNTVSYVQTLIAL